MNPSKKAIVFFSLVAVLFIPVAYFGYTAVTFAISHFTSTDGNITSEESRIPDVKEISLSMKKAEKLITNEVSISFPMKHKITIEKNIFGVDNLWPDWDEEVELHLNGKVSLGLNLAVLKPSDIAVDRSSRKIYLRLPAIEIIDTSIDSNTVQIKDRTGNHFLGDFHKELESRALKKAKQVMMGVYECQREKAVKEAKRSAEVSLSKLLHPLALDYTLVFNWQEGT